MSWIRELRLKGFQSFVDPANLALPESGVVLINGKNLDTKGGSGAGKSNLIGSIAYLFDYSPYPATELKSWYAEDMEVSATLDTKLGQATVTRAPGSLKVEVAGKVHRGAAAEKVLQQLHGLPVAFLEPMTYRQQQKPGRPSGGFLGMGPADKARFLSRLLDLDRFDAEHDKAKKIADELEVQLEAERAALERSRAELEAARAAAAELPTADHGVEDARCEVGRVREQIAEVDRRILLVEEERDRAQAQEVAVVRDIQRRYSEREREIRASASDDGRLQEQVNACRERVDGARRQEQVRRQLFDRDLREARAALAQANRELAGLGDPERDLLAARADLSAVTQMLCNVCRRPWEGADQQAEVLALEGRIRALEGSLGSKRAILDRLPELEAAAAVQFKPSEVLVKLEGLLARLEREAGERRAARKAQTEAALLRLRAEQRTEMEAASSASAAAGGMVARLRGVRGKIELSLVSAERRLALAQERERSAAQLSAERAARLERAQAAVLADLDKVATTASALGQERDFAALVGRTGYLGAIFDEVLEDISQRASSIMSALPNVSHCSIKLKSTKATKAGERRAITPVIFIDGNERPIQSCSGGMTSSITLAVDLAVSQVIADRTGTRPGWLILDECFDGMDPVTKEACLELLRDTAEIQGILILVIDHGAELKEMFEKVVTVAFQNGRSWLETRYDGA